MPANKKSITEFHLVHGQACAILLPEVIRYNGIQSKKLSVWPKVERYCADEKYAKICRTLGLVVPSKEVAKRRTRRCRLEPRQGHRNRKDFLLGHPDEKLDENKLEVLGCLAYEDQGTPAKQRKSLVADMV